MTEEEFRKRKKFAGETKPSMNRRRVGHDYTSRRMYLITMTVEGRRPLLGWLVGQEADTPEAVEARVEPTALGRRVQEEWFAVTAHHPEVTAVSLQLMPDHMHGILFVQQAMQQHLGTIISGFKASTNKAYRQLVLAQGATAVAETAATPQHSQQAEPSAPVSTVAAPSASSSDVAAPSASASDVAAPSASAPDVGYAAALPQPKRDRSHESREHGLLWSPGYNDHVLSSEGELGNWRQYLADNPRRLFLRRCFPDLFRVSFGLQIGPFTCSAVGNRFLLSYPQRKQVQCSTHFYEEDIQKAVAKYIVAARGGSVLISPAISEGEKRTMRTAFDAGLPLILITSNGLGPYSKPGGAYFDACAEGRLLILSPFEHQNRNVKLTRSMCMQMNELARLIAAAPPQHSEQTTSPAATASSASAPAVGCAAAVPQPNREQPNNNNNETETFTINRPCGNDCDNECS